MTNRNTIHVFEGKARLRRYEVKGVRLTVGDLLGLEWHSHVLSETTEAGSKLTPAARQIVNETLKVLGGTYEIYVAGHEIYLVRDEKGRWDHIDTQMLGIIKEAVWPNQAVEMWTIKAPRPKRSAFEPDTEESKSA